MASKNASIALSQSLEHIEDSVDFYSLHSTKVVVIFLVLFVMYICIPGFIGNVAVVLAVILRRSMWTYNYVIASSLALTDVITVIPGYFIFVFVYIFPGLQVPRFFAFLGNLVFSQAVFICFSLPSIDLLVLSLLIGTAESTTNSSARVCWHSVGWLASSRRFSFAVPTKSTF